MPIRCFPSLKKNLCCAMLSCIQLFATPWMQSPPGSSVHGILQARILEWVAISSSRGSSQPRNWTQVSCVSCIGREILYHHATWESSNESISSVQFSHSVVSDSLRPHASQHTRPPCPSPTPRVWMHRWLQRWTERRVTFQMGPRH